MRVGVCGWVGSLAVARHCREPVLCSQWPHDGKRSHPISPPPQRATSLAGDALSGAVESGLRSVNLWNNGVADKQARAYSGGMKRRLSVAISFMGDPLVVYLDEPSTVGGWLSCGCAGG